MPEIDTSSWQPIGETSNIRYYEIEPHIIAAVPHQGSSDTGATARENIDYFGELHGMSSAAIVERLALKSLQASAVDRATLADPEVRAAYTRALQTAD